MDAEASPITWFNLPLWAGRTAGSSILTYRRKRRPWSAARLRALVRPNLEDPVFLLGAPRSGTTFLGSCLAELPEISYHFEPVATKAAARCVADRVWSEEKAARFYRRVYSWLLRIHGDADLRFAEKTPRNSLLVPFLASAFPGASFLHLLRDGRDAALSLSRQPWLQEAAGASGRREPGGYLHGPYPRFWVEPERRGEFATTSDFHRAAWAWRVLAGGAAEGVAHVDGVACLDLRYEELVSTPARHAERIADFLGIANPGSRATLTDALSAAREESVGRWRRELTADQLDAFRREAGDTLTRLGYQWD